MRQIASLFSVDNTTNKDMELSEIWRKDKEEYEKLYKRWGSLTGEIDGLNKKMGELKKKLKPRTFEEGKLLWTIKGSVSDGRFMVNQIKYNKEYPVHQRIIKSGYYFESDEQAMQFVKGMEELLYKLHYKKEIEKPIDLSTRIIDTDLSIRIINILNSCEISTIGELLKIKRVEIRRFRNFGRKSMLELDNFMTHNNLKYNENKH